MRADVPRPSFPQIAVRLPIVGVMGASQASHVERAAPLGHWLAGRGVHLLTGGGSGAMAAVSEAFYNTEGRRGLVLGILPADEGTSQPRPGYPNPWVEIPIRTHLPWSSVRGTDPQSRNHINILTSDVIVALPGSEGTASEVALALTYGRPIVAFVESRDEIPRLSESVPLAGTFEEVCQFLEEQLAHHTLDR